MLFWLRGQTRWFGLAMIGLTATLAGGGANENDAYGQNRQEGGRLNYPNTERADVSDNYHGTRVDDPYRWLEDTDSPATKAWVKAQNELTFSYLKKLPSRKQLQQRLTKLWNYERYGLPRKAGSRYLYSHNDGLQNQAVLYVADSLDDEPRQLLDPNKLSEDGTVALAGWDASENGALLAYGLAASGSDWRTWKVRDIATGKDLEDEVEWVKFSGISWTPDNKGFFYSRYDKPAEGAEFTGTNYFHKLYYHRIGEPQSQDKLVYQRRDEKEWGFGGTVTEDGKFLIIGVWKGTLQENQLFYKRLDRPGAEVVELIRGFDAEYQFVGNEGDLFWLVTDKDAPKRRVVAVDINRPEPEHWRELIAESPHVLEGVSLVGDRFIAAYLENAQSRVRVFDLQGKPAGEVPLPAIGTAGGFGGKRRDQETFFSFSNYTTPTTIFRYEPGTGQRTVFRQPQVDFEPSDYETRQVFYRSKDGTKVPMFITHRKGLELDGQRPTILYGYGGFNISLTPGFSVSNLVWLESGGIYAVPNLRGGGEFGREWHEAGMLGKKQNVFDDFIGAARWLIDNGYTNSDKLAVRGGSNGGLLVGAAMTQQPDLFAAAIPAVGVMDMLRYHKFTIGWAWVSEYGSSDSADAFRWLHAYSPIHNLKAGTRYPATMVTTADHDDRVVPGHSFKFAATLQATHDGPEPVLIRIESSAGHGAGTPTSKRIEAAADALAFLEHVLKME